MLSLNQCVHFEQKECDSCQWLAQQYAQQIDKKTAELYRLLADFVNEKQILPPVISPQFAFRNKAKMVVSGSVERPILGLLKDPNNAQSGVDLSDCLLYPDSIKSLFPILKDFIARAGLVPYNTEKKRGELKYILITESRFNGALLIRFVVKSKVKISLVERELNGLLAKLPPQSVVSLNIQPKHAAILEGEEEIILTPSQTIEERFNDVPLFIRPQGFFQTNPIVASRLYHTAQQWIQDLHIKLLWDLFCGVGGFGLHCLKTAQATNPNASLIGIEISPSAIASATQSATQLNLQNVHFASLDAASFALNEEGGLPDLVIVNPPRRGIGETLAGFLNQLSSPYLLYSSCNAKTLAKDLAFLTHYQVEKVQLFDMFPHTSHYEVLVLLQKR